jgi:tripartite-type tricarboxylate transporter receptor subunit TctC|tara:strand:- start:6282 stop:7241 length:960 start_codon:yes stop_codon:yes gene_type:complete
MRIINFVSKCLLTIGLITVATPVLAFPEKPIEFVIPFGAGGGADIEGRLLAQEMAKVLGVSVMPVNRKGGGGAIAYTHTRNAKPDGYTIAWNSTSVLTTTNLGNTDFAYDAMDHVGRVEFQPQPFAVKSSSKWKTFKDFVTDCKASPGTLKVANSGTGSATHTAAIALMNAAGCKVIHLPKGIKGRNKSVLNGEADAMIAPLTGAVNLTKAGKIRLLAMPTDKRNDIFPNVPTAKELGYNASLDLFRGLSVPPNTPDKIKSILADAMAKAANSDAFLALAKKKGFKVSPLGHKEFGELLSREDKKVKAIFASAGLLKNK